MTSGAKNPDSGRDLEDFFLSAGVAGGDLGPEEAPSGADASTTGGEARLVQVEAGAFRSIRCNR